jgi:hypothetical protein
VGKKNFYFPLDLHENNGYSFETGVVRLNDGGRGAG